MINSINYSLLTNHLLDTMVKRALVYYSEMAGSNAFLNPFISSVEEASQEFTKGFEHDNTDPNTTPKRKIDLRRDQDFIAFRNYVEAASHRSLPDWNEAAEKILQVIRKHGWSMWKKGYKAQSSVAAALYSELRSTCSDELSTLQAEEWLAPAEESQQAFELFVQDIAADTNNQPTLTETRPVLEDAFRSLLGVTSYLPKTMPGDEMDALINKLNEIIGETMAVARAADTRNKNKNKEDDLPVE